MNHYSLRDKLILAHLKLLPLVSELILILGLNSVTYVRLMHNEILIRFDTAAAGVVRLRLVEDVVVAVMDLILVEGVF